MRKAKWMIALIWLLGVQMVQAQGDKRASAILDQMSTKYKNMKTFSANFTYGPDSPSAKKMTGAVVVKGVKFKLNMVGQEIYNNGKEIYTYVKETNEVNIMDYDASADSDFSPTKIYSIYKKGYKYLFKQEMKVGSQVFEVVELSPTAKTSNVTKIQITVDKKDKSIKSWRIWDKKGKSTLFKVDKFVPNVPANDALFTFDKSKYPGVEVVDLR
jgi:outer membrane lipoprotein-sorting protein